MNNVSRSVLVFSVSISLLIGGVVGFFLGIASTKVGKSFVEEMFENERRAEVSKPKKLQREMFEVQYPSNWRVDTDDEDYDPDHMFSIESPGNAFVMFVLGSGEMEPADLLQIQIEEFEKLMSNGTVETFEKYGRLSGKGATLKGKIMGIRTTVKLTGRPS